MITLSLDKHIRNYALRLDSENGEDAYHNAVLSYIQQRKNIVSPMGYLVHAIRNELKHIYRWNSTQWALSAMFVEGIEPAHLKNLRDGRKKYNVRRSHCKKGHLLEEPNLSYIGYRRTCLACRRETNRNASRRHNAKSKIR